MDVDDWAKYLVYGILAIAGLGVILGVSTAWLMAVFVHWMEALLIGIVCGAIAVGIAKLVTDELPPALLAGGMTTTVVTVVVRLLLWIKVHSG